ncbi:MAG TPA: hypothetical protein P5564_07895 [Paludibacteraceae bacterium]|jgi:hypothetical protein|nr:hypothetical protein [Paludibacteraceae bacterium]
MEERQALEVAIQGIALAQKSGVYQLEDAAVLYQAVQYMQNRINEIEEEENKESQ